MEKRVRLIIGCAWVTAAALAAGCAPSDHGRRFAKVRLVPPQARHPGRNKGVCELHFSRFTAHSPTLGTVAADSVVTVDLEALGSIATGEPVLTFTEVVEMTLEEGPDWVFSYLGSFGATNCETGNTRLNYGYTDATPITAAGATVPITVDLIGQALVSGSTTVEGTPFANLKVHFGNGAGGSCSSEGTFVLKTAGGDSISAGSVSYSASGTPDDIDLLITPIPKNMRGLVLVISQTGGGGATAKTYTIGFNTNSSDSQTVDATAETQFCQ